ERQRQALEDVALGDADRVEQAQRFAIRADADVRAVVEVAAVRDDVAGAATRRRRHLEERDVGAGTSRLDRGGEPGPARADDGDAERRHYRAARRLIARASSSASRSRAS